MSISVSGEVEKLATGVPVESNAPAVVCDGTGTVGDTVPATVAVAFPIFDAQETAGFCDMPGARANSALFEISPSLRVKTGRKIDVVVIFGAVDASVPTCVTNSTMKSGGSDNEKSNVFVLSKTEICHVRIMAAVKSIGVEEIPVESTAMKPE